MVRLYHSHTGTHWLPGNLHYIAGFAQAHPPTFTPTPTHPHSHPHTHTHVHVHTHTYTYMYTHTHTHTYTYTYTHTHTHIHTHTHEFSCRDTNLEMYSTQNIITVLAHIGSTYICSCVSNQLLLNTSYHIEMQLWRHSCMHGRNTLMVTTSIALAVTIYIYMMMQPYRLSCIGTSFRLQNTYPNHCFLSYSMNSYMMS